MEPVTNSALYTDTQRMELANEVFRADVRSGRMHFAAMPGWAGFRPRTVG